VARSEDGYGQEAGIPKEGGGEKARGAETVGEEASGEEASGEETGHEETGGEEAGHEKGSAEKTGREKAGAQEGSGQEKSAREEVRHEEGNEAAGDPGTEEGRPSEVSVILVPIDGSQAGERAVRRAAERAAEQDAKVFVLHVLPATFVREKQAQIDPASQDDEERFSQGIVDRALALLTEHGVEAEGSILEGVPAEVILARIAELSPSLVVMGTRGLRDVMPEGSVSKRVMEASPAPVEIVE
jgi:nucleotide-binding universal stress UspA family protein